jgi:Carboxypeptidase regulatory-like domain
MSYRALAAAVFLLCLPVGFAFAQSTFGDIRGTSRDQTDSPLGSVNVVVHNLDENTDRTATSENDGSFVVQNLKPGHYELRGTKQGFATSTAVKVELTARQSLRVDLVLSLDQHTETVNVSETVEQINTENGVIGDSKTTAQITQLPTNIRAQSTSPLGALGVSPNVQQDSQGNMAVAGATSNMVGFSVDGISTANIVSNGALQNAYPSAEGIAELKVTAFNNNAEFAQVGDVTFTTKAGTNQFHGSLFEYLQNDALDAKTLNFSVKAPKRFNTFGGSIGGPVSIPKLYNGKDKTFFFFDYEGNRRRTSTPQQFLVPTLEQRNGDLSGLPIANNTLLNPGQQTAFANNTIPVSMLNPSSQALLRDYYPLPNVDIPGASYNYQNLQSTPSNTNGVDFRIDHTITDKQQVYARLSWKNILTNVANPLLPNDVDQEHDRSLVVSHNYAITPRLLNEFRFGFTRTVIGVNFPINGVGTLDQLGLQGVDVSQHPATNAFPSFNFSDGTGFQTIGRDKTGVTRSKTYEFTDNLTYTLGKHTLRFGADIRKINYFSPATFTASDDFGLFTFNQGVFTGSSFGDFLLGAPNTSYFAVTAPDINANTVQTGIYAQDEWQVNDRLTINFGLRWTVLPAFTERIGDLGNFDPRLNSIIVPNSLLNTVASSPGLQSQYLGFQQSFNACTLPGRDLNLPCTNVMTASQAHLPQGVRQLYLGNYQPRVSFAYRPFRDNKTVLRAGFGIFTITNLGPLSFNNASNPLSVIHNFQNNANGQAQFEFPLTSPPNLAAAYGGGTLEQGVNPRYRDPQSAQWNVTLERELNANTALRLSYVGMNSYRLNVTEDLNQVRASNVPYVASPFVDPRAPYGNWFSVFSTENAGFQNYQALQVELSRRMSNGLMFQANYTWSKDLSDAQGDAPSGYTSEVLYGLAVSDRFNLRTDRGNVAGNRTHRFLLTGTYELPFGTGRHWSSHSKVTNAILGGWNLNTITLLQTGPWLTPTTSPSLDQSNTNIAGRGTVLRPDLIGNPIPSQQSSQNYFNINAFAPTPTGAARIGNGGVGILEAPGTVAVNAGISKVFQITEGIRLRLESTFTNVLNRTNFAPPATNVSSPNTFGVLQSAQTAENGGNRTGQVALRLDF